MPKIQGWGDNGVVASGWKSRVNSLDLAIIRLGACMKGAHHVHPILRRLARFRFLLKQSYLNAGTDPSPELRGRIMISHWLGGSLHVLSHCTLMILTGYFEYEWL